MKNDINSVLVEGVLVEDPKATYAGSRVLCDLRIVNTGWTSEGTIWRRSYLDLRARGRNAVSCINHLKKGMKIRVAGRLLQELGGKTVIEVETVEFPTEANEPTPADMGVRAARDEKGTREA